MNKKNPKLKKMKMQKRVTQIEGGRYLIYYSFKTKKEETRNYNN